jgi:hypothetical protein
MQGGYGAIARELTRLTGLNFSRQQVHIWNKRRTLNAAGQPFPSPVRARRGARPPQVRLEFDLGQVLAWMEPGIPANHGHDWWTPAGIARRGSVLT